MPDNQKNLPYISSYHKDGKVQVYLAGKMRGIPEFNFPAFLDGAKQLRDRGFAVFCPAENDLNNGFDPVLGKYETNEGGDTFNIRKALRDDLCWICEYADAIVVLPGWEKSLGASSEVFAARCIGIPVVTLGDALEGRMVSVFEDPSF